MQKFSPLIPSTIAAASLGALAATAAAQLTNPIGLGTQHIYLDQTTDVGTAALDMAVAPGETNRSFFVTQGGTVRTYKNGALLGTAYVNIASHVPLIATGERGLLGLAFHPEFNTSGAPGFGKFYTYTSETKVGDADFSHIEIGLAGGDHQSVIREWTVNPALDALTGTPTNRILMRIAQPQANHNGGAMRFGNDNMLYFSLGDGGGGNDNSGGVTSPTDGHTNDTGNAQDIVGATSTDIRYGNVLGKILRINPFGNNSTNGAYGIPADNPFVGATTGVDEIFAYGLRNPFRMNFDRVTGKLYVGDVGQGAREEVDVVESGKNYGWVYKEGTRDNRTPFPSGFTPIAPIGEYTNNDGHSVMGGFVYRGSIPELEGRYVFGDYNGNAGVGRLFHMPVGGGTIQEFRYDGTTMTGSTLYGWGQDAMGELYALFADGTVKRLVGADAWRLTSGGGAWDTASNWTSGTRDMGGVWTGAAPNAVGATARFLNGPIVPANITIGSPKTVGTMLFNSGVAYTLTGAGITLDNGASAPTITVRNGSHTIVSAVTFNGNATVNVMNAPSVLTMSNGLTAQPSLSAPAWNLIKSGAGRLDVSRVGANQLFVSAGRLRVLPNGGASSVSRVNTLQVNPGATFDLSDNDLIVDYSGTSPYDTLRDYVVDGRDGTGGIVTTPAGDRTLALAEAADLNVTSWLGQPVNTTTIIGKHTYYGDSNLDGQVTGDDYLSVDAGLGLGSMWTEGDFNFDAAVTGDDYLAIDANLGKGTVTPLAFAELKAEMVALHAAMFGEEYLAKLAFVEANGFGATVPEPAGVALLLGAASLLTRRRRT